MGLSVKWEKRQSGIKPARQDMYRITGNPVLLKGQGCDKGQDIKEWLVFFEMPEELSA